MNLVRIREHVMKVDYYGRIVGLLVVLGVCAGCGPVDTDEKPDEDWTLEDAGETESGEPTLEVVGSVTFEGASIGNSSRREIAIENTGSGPLVVDRVALTEGDADEVGEFEKGEPWFDGAEILPGESKSLAVVYAPQNIFEDSGQLTFQTNDPDRAEVTVALKSPDLGNPPPREPCLKMEPEPQKFGGVVVGESKSRTFTLAHCRESGPPLQVEGLSIRSDRDGAFRLPSAAEEEFEIPAGSSEEVTVTFQPPRAEAFRGLLEFYTNASVKEPVEVTLSGQGEKDASSCPRAVARAQLKGVNTPPKSDLSTAPLETLRLQGGQSSDPDGSIARYEWSIVKRPADSTATLAPDASTKNPDLFLDLAGTYELELSVTDEGGNVQCGDPARVTIEAIPQEDIYVELVWDSPKDNDQTDGMGTDLDLHYRKAEAPWNQSPGDIFSLNKTADWGRQGDSSDDPSLKVGDDDGAGPEAVGHDNPATGGGYTIGVYYYDAKDYGPSYASVRVYIDGALKQEYTNKFLKKTYKFWEIAEVTWPMKALYKRDRIHEGFPN